MPKPLVIVESPAKAKTIARFLGDDYVVESSLGHIRDLPRSAAEVPAAYKAEPWSRLGVDVDNDFKPLYVVASEKQAQVKRLRSLLKQASELYLATDEDREGESIAWHLLEVLSPQVPVKRMVFHEITKPAIELAIEHPRELDRRLVDAQEARRILDRLYGYELSPVLWKKVMQGLSAGRVQSVATRIIVERERERMHFRSGSWWSLTGAFRTESGENFQAALDVIDGRRVADGSDFTSSGELADPSGPVLLDEDKSRALAGALEGSSFSVKSLDSKPYRRSPSAPFITSTLQQEAARKLRFSARRTMQVAQGLYEDGFITYMRTDSTTLSNTALSAARAQAKALFGDALVPARPRTYDRKVKNAQEAHEAIRPAGDTFRAPSSVASSLGTDGRRLYELIFKRTVASQMVDATGVTARLRIVGETTTDTTAARRGATAEFATAGTVITNPGFLLVYKEDEDDDEATQEGDGRLPEVAEGDALGVESFDTEEHATRPPARFTEASLVRRLEELGVGRPSTYASTLQTIQDRGYVWKKGSALVPSFLAFAVVGLLEQYFPSLVDYNFTAAMEDDLDEIANGEEEAVPWLERFYFGDGNGKSPAAEHSTIESGAGLKQAVLDQLAEIDAREVNSIPIGDDPDGVPVVVRVGRYGPYLQRGEDRAPIPEDLAPDELSVERALELLAAPSNDRELGPDPESGLPVLVRTGRFGPYVQLGAADDPADKPPRASLFKSMSPESVTLEQALDLLRLPRTVGVEPGTGEEIVARNGRYGPYLQRGKDSRSLETEEQLFEVTLEQALDLFSRPKQRRFGRAAQRPAREIGKDPDSGATILLREGRFGPYVTDGELNASLRRGDDPNSVTLERATELLAERRAAGPRTPRRARAAKKSSANKAVKKRAAKKAVSKKVAAKKVATKRARPKASNDGE
ncbi:MAG TPA: type I DNA topoisomerase [Acidimicrobiales bacterium]|nr:type I DNA topoisomerase [Acidimicrobiales bacterium]